MEPKVAVLTGSKSDLPLIIKCEDILNWYGIKYEIKVLSAHRTPHETTEYVENIKSAGIDVVICAAGMAAHLAGIVAAHTTIPVIGVPITSGELGGLDALLSTVQMPNGIPVATVAINGIKNAIHLAAQILALKYPELESKIEKHRQEMKEDILS